MDDLVQVKDLPPTLIEAVVQQLAHYTIAFLRPKSVGNEWDADLLGTGVLVATGRQRAILTAHHVLQELPATGRISIFIGRTTLPHTLDTEGLSVIKIARGTQDAIGPDLGAIVLAPQIAGSIAARKSFFNLDRYRDVVLSSPPAFDDGVWFAQGFLEERTAVRPDRTETGPTKFLYNFTGCGGPDASPQIGDFDYLEFPVSHASRHEAPVSWGGMSGGGLWQVRLKREDGQLVPLSPVLSGLMFYQHPTTPTECGVRGHGRRSIYEVAHRLMNGASP
jgi:hypothetical protein